MTQTTRPSDRRARGRRIIGAAAVALAMLVLAPAAGATTFSGGGLAVPAASSSDGAGVANPYPSTIAVSGLSGTVTDVNVTLDGLNHTFPDDLDVLLVGPAGQTVAIVSDAGGGTDVSAVNLTLDDSASGFLPDLGSLASGTYKPTDFEADAGYPAPAPAGSPGNLLSAFDGTDPNGTWSLYVVDDGVADVGSISGWSLDIASGTPPQSQTVPQVSGGAVQGQTLSATDGTWTGDPTPAYTYQWNRCNPSSCVPEAIPGATGSSHALTSAEVGKLVWIVVTATNVAGQASRSSAAAGPVTAAASTPPPPQEGDDPPQGSTPPVRTACCVSGDPDEGDDGDDGGGDGGSRGGRTPGSPVAAKVTALLVAPKAFRAAGTGPSAVALPGSRPAPSGGGGRGGAGGGDAGGGDEGGEEGAAPTTERPKRRPSTGGAEESVEAEAAARVGATVSYRLDRAATATFRVQKPAPGRKVGRSCKKPTRANRAGRRCARWVTLPGLFRHTGVTGVNRFKFTGRLRGRKLRPGRYRLAITAKAGSAAASKVRTASFRLVR